MLANKDLFISSSTPSLLASIAGEDMKMWNPHLTRLSSHTNRSDIVWGFPSGQLKSQKARSTFHPSIGNFRSQSFNLPSLGFAVETLALGTTSCFAGFAPFRYDDRTDRKS